MTGGKPSDAGLSGSYLTVGNSFFDFACAQAASMAVDMGWPAGLGGSSYETPGAGGKESAWLLPPAATTIVALTYPGGLVMVGDRRATMGTQIASRDIEKVYPADAASAIGVAGSAGLALQLVRLFQVELEHYEKIEGEPLSLDGKANRLATLLRPGLPMALRGLAAVPIFGGFEAGRGRIFSYDVTGGLYEEHDFHAIGSGSVFARGSLKKLWHDDLDSADAIAVALAALVDASEDDAATAGIDHERSIWPVVALIDAHGYRRVDEAELAEDLARVAVTQTSSSGSRTRPKIPPKSSPARKSTSSRTRKAGNS